MVVCQHHRGRDALLLSKRSQFLACLATWTASLFIVPWETILTKEYVGRKMGGLKCNMVGGVPQGDMWETPDMYLYTVHFLLLAFYTWRVLNVLIGNQVLSIVCDVGVIGLVGRCGC